MLRPLHFEVGRFPFFLGGGVEDSLAPHQCCVSVFLSFRFEKEGALWRLVGEIAAAATAAASGRGWMDGWVGGRTNGCGVCGRERDDAPGLSSYGLCVGCHQPEERGKGGESSNCCGLGSEPVGRACIYVCNFFFKLFGSIDIFTTYSGCRFRKVNCCILACILWRCMNQALDSSDFFVSPFAVPCPGGIQYFKASSQNICCCPLTRPEEKEEDDDPQGQLPVLQVQRQDRSVGGIENLFMDGL